MNRFIAKVGIAVVAVPVMAGVSMWQKSKAIDVYQISEFDLPIMENCSNAMDAHNMDFSDEVPVVLVCACIAKHATSSIASSDLPVYVETSNAEVSFAAQSYYLDYGDEAGLEALNVKADQAFQKIRRKAGMMESKYESLFSKMVKIEETCTDVQTHTGDELTRLAALTPMGSASVVERVSPATKKTDAEVALMLR